MVYIIRIVVCLLSLIVIMPSLCQAEEIIGYAKNKNGEIVAVVKQSDQTPRQNVPPKNPTKEKGSNVAAERQAIIEHILDWNNSHAREAAEYIAECILTSCARYGVNPLLMTALFTQESSFNPIAVSSAGAMGLGQLMPATAESLGVTDPFDIEQNIDGSVQYLAYQLKRFEDTGEWQLTYAVAAYNAGPGSILKYDGVPPYRETVDYVYRIADIYNSLLTRMKR